MEASMSSATLVSVADYLRRTEKPTCEYDEGVLSPKSMPTKIHSLLQYILVGMLRGQAVDALHEVMVRISSTQFLVPDVIAAKKIEDPYPTEPVELCVEILSPDDRIGAMLAKCERYHAWGVPHCWVIDPEKRSAWQYDKDGEPIPVSSKGVLRAGVLEVSLPTLFAGLLE
jgi:Uma2 family endonuclease